MEKDQHQPEERRDNDTPVAQESIEVTAETIHTRIAEELEKVVGLDTDRLQQYVDFLGTLPKKATETLVTTLKTTEGEKVLPLLELMTQHADAGLVELGINVLGKIQSFKAAQLLADIDQNHPNKKIRKAARKSLYKLKSAGIEIETTHKPLLGETKHERYKCMLSPVDGTGTQLVMLTQELLAGDLQLLQTVISDEEGIIDCSSRRGVTKKMFAKLPENFARQTGGAGPMLFEADYDYAMTLLLEAEDLTDSAPGDYISSQDFFGLSDAEPVENPVFQMLDAENLKEQPYFLRTSAELFQQETFLSWHLALKSMGEYAQELMDQEGGVIEVTPQFDHSRKEEIYQKIAEDQFTDEMIQRLRRRLQIMAYLFMLQDKEEDAKKALTAAVTLEQTEPSAYVAHPFLRELLLISLDAARYVIEDGYNPEEFDREQYVVLRNDEGEIVVEYLEQ